MTHDADARERILDLADDLRDMSRRIANCDGEPNYAAEKAWRAAKAAVRIMAVADARAGGSLDHDPFDELRKEYMNELRDHGNAAQGAGR